MEEFEIHDTEISIRRYYLSLIIVCSVFGVIYLIILYLNFFNRLPFSKEILFFSNITFFVSMLFGGAAIYICRLSMDFIEVLKNDLHEKERKILYLQEEIENVKRKT